MWLSYSKFFKLVSCDIVSCWIKNVLEKVGINIKVFLVYSIWVVVIFVVYLNNVFINIIMEVVGWFRESIFRIFYDKLVIRVVNFGE